MHMLCVGYSLCLYAKMKGSVVFRKRFAARLRCLGDVIQKGARACCPGHGK
jgi:hypothetical protein